MEYQNENFGGIYDFRCRYHNGWDMGQHIHEYCELLYCKDGECEILINGRSVFLKKGQFAWIPPNYAHQYKKTEAKLICAVFSSDFIQVYFHLIKSRKPIVDAIDACELSQMIEKLPAISADDILLICGYLNLICDKVVKKSNFEVSSDADGELYQKMIDFIGEHFREDITLKTLARELNYNEKYLSHFLHSLINMNFTEVVATYRIEYAKNLILADKKRSISEIAFASGFNAINTFNRMFKKITDMTPTQYKNMFKLM